MAVLPVIKRFVSDDFAGIKDIPSFCNRLFYPLNSFLNAVYSALSNGLTLAANTIGMVQSLSSITSNSSGIATTTINWAYPQSPPVGLAILSCTKNSVAVSYPLVTWSYAAGVINITMQFVAVSSGAIVAAPAGTYAITFWVTGG